MLVAEPGRFGTELLRATGTADYVNALGFLPAHAEETAVYDEMGIPWCPPELREEPFRDEPPPLVELADVRGDLHRHTTWSDGRRRCSRWQRPRAISATSISPSAITRNVRVVPGLDADDLRRQGEEIAEANERLAPFRVLRGTEVDIKGDGSLDLPDDILDELDWVQLSLAGQREAREPLTRKVTEAMRHPAVSCLSHPRGRIINHRPRTPSILSRSSRLPSRRAWRWRPTACQIAWISQGRKYALRLRPASPSSPRRTHSVQGLGNMQLAIATARRGRARAANIVNTKPLDEILRHKHDP